MWNRPTTPADWLRLSIDWGLVLAAAGMILILALRAAVSIDTSHDTWWYHLPWAARLADLMPAQDYVFDDFLEQRYLGFPVLMEWFQGQLWRISGRPEATNFVALTSLVLFVAFLRRRFLVPAHLSLIALIAVPLIHIHATAPHVDLPSNLALTAALLLLIPLFSRQTPIGPEDLALFAVTCALAALSKMQLIPVVALVFAAGCVALFLDYRRRRPDRPRSRARILICGLILALVAAGIFYVPIKNTALYNNPFYPIALKVGPIELGGPETGYIPHGDRLERLVAARERLNANAPPRSQVRPPDHRRQHQVPARSEAAVPQQEPSRSIGSNPLAWAESVLEIGMEPLLGRGQWVLLGAQHAPLPTRYGGYFGWYVLFHLVLFAVLIGRRLRDRWGLIALFLATTVVASLLPNQTILRYYMFWMILLVSLNLIMLRPPAPVVSSSPRTDLQRLTGVVGLLAFLLVVYATRAEFFQPRFRFLEDILEIRRDPGILARVESNAATCLAGERAPRMFGYAPIFNPGKDYRLKMGPIAGDRADTVAPACGPGWTPVIAIREDAGLLPVRRPN